MKRYTALIAVAIAICIIFDWSKEMVEVAIFFAVWGIIIGRTSKQ